MKLSYSVVLCLCSMMFISAAVSVNAGNIPLPNEEEPVNKEVCIKDLTDLINLYEDKCEIYKKAIDLAKKLATELDAELDAELAKELATELDAERAKKLATELNAKREAINHLGIRINDIDVLSKTAKEWLGKLEKDEEFSVSDYSAWKKASRPWKGEGNFSEEVSVAESSLIGNFEMLADDLLRLARLKDQYEQYKSNPTYSDWVEYIEREKKRLEKQIEIEKATLEGSLHQKKQ